MRFALVVSTTAVFGIHAPSAWCESTARSPSTVVAAVVARDPANASIETIADDIAAALRIDRAASSQRWQTKVRDEYKAPPDSAIAEAQAEVALDCPDEFSRASSRALVDAAQTLAQVTGDAPTSSLPTNWAWAARSASARLAQRCLGGTREPISMRINVSARPDRTWTLYVNGFDIVTEQGEKTVSSMVAPHQDLWIHVRCNNDVRCSRTIHVTDPTQPVTLYVDAVEGRTEGTMSGESLTLVYSSELDRNNSIAKDAAVVAYVLGNAGGHDGDAITVMAEGDGVRLVYSDDAGKPIRTQRTTRESAVEAALRLASGASQTAVLPLAGGQPPSGAHRVRVDFHGDSPKITEVQSPLDPTAVPGAAVCKRTGCSFSVPAGLLRMRFDESEWSGPLEKSIDVDKNLLVTVTPGRRYWAKYAGMGMMGVGGTGMALVTLIGGLENKIGSAHSPSLSGPSSDADKPAKASAVEAGIFFGGAGTVAVGALLYFVVHKKPHIRVTPLGAVTEMEF